MLCTVLRSTISASRPQRDLAAENRGPGGQWLEYDSMSNLRPSFGNRTRGVADPSIRARIAALADELVRRCWTRGTSWS